MKSICKPIIFSFLVIFFCFSFIPLVCSMEHYDERKDVTYKYIPKETPSFEAEEILFVNSFDENYQGVPPHQIKDHFKNRNDVRNWLTETVREEWNYFKTVSHPIHWINIDKDNALIGLVIVEQWNNENGTWHVRQMAIVPENQHQGYGTASINHIRDFLKADKIIADARILNSKALNFWKKIGFKEGEPHDPELRSTGKYVGLTWRRPS